MIGEVTGMLELDELIDGLPAAIQRNVPSDFVSLNDIGPDTDRVIAIALSRSERDFSDEDREVIERARPYLIQAWRNAIDHTALRDELAARPLGPTGGDGITLAALRARGLTDRQGEVLALVARGRSNRDAGAILGISDRTVQKHLEHCYRVLDLPGRSAAAEFVWGLLAETAAGPNGTSGEPGRRGLDGRPGAVPGADGSELPAA